MADYGTGFVMGVPGHDERDYDFAKKYGLEIIEVIKKPEDFKEEFYVGDGEMLNSGKYNGMNSKNFREEIIELLKKEGKGLKSKQYKIRPQIFSRQRYWGEPIPIIYKENGEVETIPDEDLPLELPYMEDFLPDEDGSAPLEKATDWVQTMDSEGNPAKRETDTMPTWAGSNWYYLRYIDPNNDTAVADPEKVKYWFPVDMYFGDAGHTTGHLLYSRFWFKFLYDIGAVPLDEPYMYRMSGGMLLGADGQKMSKSKGNVVNPQEVLENYGADSVRTYLAFIGPYEDTYPWNPRGLVACARLVKNIYEMKDRVVENHGDNETKKNLHKMLKNITEMMADLKMNTSVSELMIFVNHLKKQEKISKRVWKNLVLAVAPFMPFTAEELWQELNGYKNWKKENSVHLQEWPKYDEELVQDEEIELPIQINGKLRDTVNVKRGLSSSEIEKIVLSQEKIKENLDGKKPKKFIYVPEKIVNIVM